MITKKFATAHHLDVGSAPVGADALRTAVTLHRARDRQRRSARPARRPDDHAAARAQRVRPAHRRARLRHLRAGCEQRRRCSPASIRLLHGAASRRRESQTAAQFKAKQGGQVNSLLALIYVLLALSVIVSLFGIVNTLVLSIYERTRELGMLRAIGTSRTPDAPDDPLRVDHHRADRRRARARARHRRRDARRRAALSGSGYVLSIPVGTLIAVLIAAAIAGLLAAHGRRGARRRVDVLARAGRPSSSSGSSRSSTVTFLRRGVSML